MLENSTKIRKKAIGPTRAIMPEDAYNDFLKLCKIRRFKSDLREATGIHDQAVARIEKSAIGKKVFVDAIITFCELYKSDLLNKGILI